MHRIDVLTAGAILLVACTASQQPPQRSTDPASAPATAGVSQVWWLDAVFDPRDSTIQGLPLRVLDSTWRAATELRLGLLPPSAAHDSSALTDSTARFLWDGDFNRDGVADRIIVGTYAKQAEVGRFMLILTGRGLKKVAHLAQQPGQAGFSAVWVRGDTLVWSECMQCDVDWTFTWTGRAYDLLPEPADSLD